MIERKTYIPFSKATEPSIDYLLGILEDVRVTTLQRVEKITTAELDWQIHPGWNTIGALLSHIIACEHCFRIEFIEGRKMNKSETGKWLAGLDLGKHLPKLIAGNSIEHYLSELEKARSLLLTAINGLTKKEFYKKRKGYNPKTGYNLAWVLYHLAEDEVHHRGQISILRKLYKTKAG